MVATAIAAISAAAAVAGAGSSIYSTLSRDQSGPQRQADYGAAQLQDAESNEQFQRMLAVLTNQRAVAGTSDSYGSTTQYDPGSNTWISKLGELPQQADTAAMQAGIRQNTTQARMAELANEQAALRAARAAPGADAAQRELTNFRPMARDTLVGLLGQQATTAANETFRPIEQDTLRQYARTGENAGPVMANLGRTQNDQLRKSLTDALITGMTGTDAVNQSRRKGLEDAATTATAFANPAFQATAVAPSANQKNLSDVLAARAQGSAYATAYGGINVNAASKGLNDPYAALRAAAGVVPSQPGADVGKELAGLAGNKGLQESLAKLFSSSSGGNPSGNPLNYDPKIYSAYSAAPYTSSQFGTTAGQLYGSGGIFGE